MTWVSAAAWLAGLVAYEAWLRVAWGQSMGSEWRVVVFWSALAFAVAAPLVYLPAMILVRQTLGGYKPVFWFPVVAALLGAVPTAIITLAWGGGLRGLLSAEASIFYVMFLAVGVVFGFGYALHRQRERSGLNRVPPP